jgi:hypothetical protein
MTPARRRGGTTYHLIDGDGYTALCGAHIGPGQHRGEAALRWQALEAVQVTVCRDCSALNAPAETSQVVTVNPNLIAAAADLWDPAYTLDEARSDSGEYLRGQVELIANLTEHDAEDVDTVKAEIERLMFERGPS